MLMAILCSSLVGAVLGLRFKVQVLFPTTPIAFVIAAGIVGVTQAALQPALLAGVAAVVALQIGYLGGLFTRFSIAASRIPQKRSTHSTTTAQS
jgi:predicted anti-sigma-YlaC factor YlaD